MNNLALQTLSDSQMKILGDFSHKISRFGVNLSAFNVDGHCLYEAGVDGVVPSQPLEEYARQLVNYKDDQAVVLGDDGRVLGFCIQRYAQPELIVLCHLVGEQTNPDQTHEFVEQLFGYFRNDWLHGDKVSGQIEKLGTELSQAYEEIILMYNLSMNMKVTKSRANFLQMACDQLTQLVQVEGITIFLEKEVDGLKQLILTAGAGLVAIDPVMADILQVHLAGELQQGNDALLDSDVDNQFKYSWPERVKNIIAVPLGSPGRMHGFMAATNIKNKPDFDTIDIKLFNSVANQCAVFIENNGLFDDLKDLFIGSLKALTSSIDAKDQYTRGHSERVAFISRWIAEHYAKDYSLSETEVHRIYLAGLLHDIGKIGVSEAVLCKKGKLDDRERGIIMSHPRIGAGILSEISQMKEIIPGVLCHHERIDGKGYPQGLSGDQVPLIGKIISLADTFDAMTSRRVYREALSIKRALSEIEKGMGTQFDETVARVFLNSDIDKLWKIIQDGFIETWDYSNFDEYGAKAVGALIR